MQLRRTILWTLSLTLFLGFQSQAQHAKVFRKDSLVIPLKITIPFQFMSVFSVGIKGAMNNSFTYNKKTFYSDAEYYSSQQYGVNTVFEWQFLKHLSIGVEPNLMQSVLINGGYSDGYICRCLVNPVTGSQIVSNKAKINYFSVPLLLKARFPIIKNRLLISSEFGYSAAWFVSGKQTLSPQNTLLFPVREIKLDKKNTPDLNYFDEGLNAGIGLSMPFKSGNIDFNTRYYKGLRDVNKYFESKNQIVSYQLGYRYVL